MVAPLHEVLHDLQSGCVTALCASLIVGGTSKGPACRKLAPSDKLSFDRMRRYSEAPLKGDAGTLRFALVHLSGEGKKHQ